MASFFGPRHTSEYAISAHCHAGNAASKLQEDITFQPHLRASESTELARYKLDFYYDRPAQQMRAFYFTLVVSSFFFFFFTRRSFAEYWKHFMARFNDVHASGYNSVGSERIWMKFGALRVYCQELALTDYVRDPCKSKSGTASRNFVFLSSK